MIDRRALLCGAALAAVSGAAQARTPGRPVSPLILGFKGLEPGEAGVEAAIAHLNAGRASGLVLFSRNCVSRAQLQRLVSHIRAATRARPLLAVDQEGGRVQRFGPAQGFSSYPSAQELARTAAPAQARGVYARMAAELRACGINMNLGPVVDVDVNPECPIIGALGRSYGAEPRSVIDYGARFLAAHAAHGVKTCAKHFPGHGSSTADSHAVTVDVTATWDRRAELAPYRALRADSVMVAHLQHAAWSGPRNLPASLSPLAVRGLLRRGCGFRGPALSDDLQMGAIAARWSTLEASLLALRAGIDFVIVGNMLKDEPELPFRLEEAIAAALRAGRLSRAGERGSARRRRALLEGLS